jgi:cystathionine gamma-synthase/methionine-gamma-lyase
MKESDDGRSLHLETLTVNHGYDPADAGGAAKPPAYLSSTFVYPSAAEAKRLHAAFFDGVENGAKGHIYGRLGHPGLDIVEARLAALDGGGDAACFASGMATVTAIMLAFLVPGDVVLHSRPTYGGTDALLHNEIARFGIKSVGFRNGVEREPLAADAERAMAEGSVGVIWVETPANPTASIVDIALVASIADEIERSQGRRPLLCVDNTFLGPFMQTPLELRADLCMTSLTKYAGGHSDLLAGGVSGSKALINRLKTARTLFGSTLDAHSAWLLARSLETLHLRTERAAANAAKIAVLLRDHPKVASVTYLGFTSPETPAGDAFERQCRGTGSTFSFRIHGDEAAAFRLLDAVKVLRLAVSLGGTETLICHPASTTHYPVPREQREEVGIDEATLRISVGIEHPDDLATDLLQALERV